MDGRGVRGAPCAPARAWRTGCWVRSRRPTTRCRRPGCGWPGRTPTPCATCGRGSPPWSRRVALDMLRSRTARRETALSNLVPDPVVEPVGWTGRRRPGTARARRPMRSGWRSRSCWRLWRRPSGWPSSCTTCSACRSSRSASSPADPVRRRSSWPAEPVAGFEQGSTVPNASPGRQRQILDAFLAAAGDGNFAGLVEILDPDVVCAPMPDRGRRCRRPCGVRPRSRVRRCGSLRLSATARPVLVNGMPGLVAMPHGRPFALLAVAIRDDRIVEMDILADPDRLARLLPVRSDRELGLDGRPVAPGPSTARTRQVTPGLPLLTIRVCDRRMSAPVTDWAALYVATLDALADLTAGTGRGVDGQARGRAGRGIDRRSAR